ncbi:type I-E CRISPR-associated protein Cse2/CasB [Streptomyces sp. 796.1]|uniref:type I-E CRISPR-associated protein Cse2/CasB n=1 Tax=Streptomyces sp. 796.1 TaxID=3163029 RepID=UPI0039C996D0
MSVPPQSGPTARPGAQPAAQPVPTAAAPAQPAARYWDRYVGGKGWRKHAPSGPPGEELADLRAGLGQTAGTVPALWPYYTSPTDGEVTAELDAEHGALALYGLHQQSQLRPMHQRGVGLGTALRALREADRYSPEALDRRVAAAVSANSTQILLFRLRGLIPQLRGESIALDYGRLLTDLTLWPRPDSRQRVRRTWGLAYHAWKPTGDAADAPPGA